MDIVIAGAHGQIAMLLHPLLVANGHRVRGLIRNPAHAPAVEAAGAQPVICDLETESDLSCAVGTADVVLFAAGAGPGSSAERKMTMDRDGALKLIDAAKRNRIARYVMISAIHAEEPRGSEVFRVYLQAKSQADSALRASGLDYTIVRPGRLTDEPATGRVSLSANLPQGHIPRADVAGVVAQVIPLASAIGHQFDLTAGKDPIASALKSL